MVVVTIRTFLASISIPGSHQRTLGKIKWSDIAPPSSIISHYFFKDLEMATILLVANSNSSF